MIKAQLTSDRKFIQLIDFNEMELEQVRYSFKRRISNWRFHPLVKKTNNTNHMLINKYL
jgi:hypothetical protein